MKQKDKPRFDAVVINRAADLPETPLLTWEVMEAGEGGSTFCVDLSQFFEGTHRGSPPLVGHAMARRSNYKPGRGGYSTVAGHPELARALASDIHVWSMTVGWRTVNETLSELKHLFNFLAAAETVGLVARTDKAWTLADMSSDLFLQFAEYLRRQGLGGARMSSVYNVARFFVERAIGHEFLPSSPFSTIPDGEDVPQYSYNQMRALLNVAKNTIRDFKRTRRNLLRRERDSVARAFIRGRLAAGGMQFSRAPEGVPAHIGHQVFPSIRVASAFVLLALLRSGANLQPILDLIPSSWNQPNPFSPKYRTVVMRKNRSGKPAVAKIIKIPTQKRPEYYLYRSLRYYELLVSPLRQAIRDRKYTKENSDVPRKRYLGAIQGHFWLFVNSTLESTRLEANAATRGINLLISEACARDPAIYACLLDGDRRPIRFSSKAIRDGWFQFVLRNSQYNLIAGQIALSHSQDSPSIRHYIRHRWARQFANREMRRFHSAAIAVLEEKAVAFGPKAIRVTLDNGDVLSLARENQTRYGAYCRDPLKPPSNIYRPTHDGDICPAISCDDCPYANYFTSSLPDLIAEIEALQQRSDEMPPYIWDGSPDWERLGRLKELLSRFPEATVLKACEEARAITVPDVRFRIGVTP